MRATSLHRVVFLFVLFVLSLVVHAQPLSVSLNVADTTLCPGDSLRLIATIQGGVPPYRSSWSGDIGDRDTIVLRNVTGDQIANIVVYDAEDNNAFADAFVNVSLPPTVSFTTIEPGCAGDATGSITAVAEGRGLYAYQWSDGSTGAVLADVAAGTYELSLTNSLGCTSSYSSSLTQPRALDFSVTVGDASCQGSLDGGASAGLGGGVRPYAFVWSDGGTGQDRFLPPGEYSVTATDANGCTLSTPVTVGIEDESRSAPEVDLEATQVSLPSACGVDDGAIDLVVNATEPSNLSFYWENEFFYYADTEDIDALAPGNYTVVVYDANGCSNRATFSLPAPVEITLDTANTVVEDISCFGEADGRIRVAMNGGAEPYSYDWSNGALGAEITDLAFNSYWVTITDANGCRLPNVEFFVDRPAQLRVRTSRSRVYPVSCPASADGAIELEVEGGTPPYRYELNGGEIRTSLDSLAAGSYTVVVIDANNCRAAGGAYTITAPEPLLADPDRGIVINGTCGQEENNYIFPGYRLGVWPYQHRWSNGSRSPALSGVPPGDYSVTVTDACGASITQSFTLGIDGATATQLSRQICAGDSVSVGGQVLRETGSYTLTLPSVANPECDSIIVLALTVNPLPAFSVSEDLEICVGGSARIRVNGAAQTFGIWSPAAGLDHPDQRTTWAAPERTTTYTYTATHPNTGCAASDSVRVVVNPLLNPIADAGPDIVTCLAEGTIGVVLGGNPSVQAPPANPSDEVIWQAWYWNDLPNPLTNEANPNLGAAAGDTFILALETNMGCTDTAVVEVRYEAGFDLTVTAYDVYCPGRGNGRIEFAVEGGTPPYSLRWSDLAGTRPLEDRTNVSAGLYFVTVTDATGCNQSATVEIGEVPFSFDPVVIQPQCGESTGSIIVGLESPLDWDVRVRNYDTQEEVADPNNLVPGWYQIDLLWEDCGIVWEFEVLETDDTNCGGLNGYARFDENGDCAATADETTEMGRLVEAVGTAGVFYTLTDEEGYYAMRIPDGEYDLRVMPPTPNWGRCELPVQVTVSSEGEAVIADLPSPPLADCPEVDVHLSTPFLRRCFSSSYYLNVCNYGTVESEPYDLILELDENLTFLNAQLPPDRVEGQLLIWERPSLSRNACYDFRVDVEVSCEVPLGTTHCSMLRAESTALEPICAPGNDNWLGASLAVTGACEMDSVVFVVTNNGAFPSTTERSYSVVADTLLLDEGMVSSLAVGASQRFAYPADGRTYHFQLDQVFDHPYSRNVGYTIEACGEPEEGAPSQGLVVQYPWGHSRPSQHTFCQDNIGSYDPNDKTAFPAGIGVRHHIYPATELNYRIRFQNTGTDTAFTVLIIDTIAPELDLRTFRKGGASHNYSLELREDRSLIFTFDDIRLPDSTTNLAASQGFVDFSITPYADLPLGTRVENQAAIYFDFNEPIFTNTTFHTVDEDFLERIDWLPALGQRAAQWRVFPNPASDYAVVDIQITDGENASGEVRLLDIHGRSLHRVVLHNGQAQFATAGLPAGMYTVQWWSSEGQLWGSGRLVVR